MTSSPRHDGRALLIPSYVLRAGHFSERRRWGTPEDLYPEDPGQLARVQRNYRNQHIHVVVPEGWTSDDLDAIEALTAHDMLVIAEGRLDTCETVSDAIEAGVDALVLERDFVAAEPNFVADLSVEVFLEVESPRTSSAFIEALTLVRDVGIDGVITPETTTDGLDVARMLQLVDLLGWGAPPLVIARVPTERASKGKALIERMAPMNVTKLLDGEFLLNMVRFSRSEVVVETVSTKDFE